jgi:hypothetical protein
MSEVHRSCSHIHRSGAPGRTRTCDRLHRSSRGLDAVATREQPRSAAGVVAKVICSPMGGRFDRFCRTASAHTRLSAPRQPTWTPLAQGRRPASQGLAGRSERRVMPLDGRGPTLCGGGGPAGQRCPPARAGLRRDALSRRGRGKSREDRTGRAGIGTITHHHDPGVLLPPPGAGNDSHEGGR